MATELATPITKDSPEHRRYLRSRAWKAKRLASIRGSGYRCATCQRFVPDARKLQVHHLTYVRLGCERPDDLMVLCMRCHRRVSTW